VRKPTVKKPKWTVTKEEKLIAAICAVNDCCNELGIAPLVPMEAAKTILEHSAAFVEAMRKYPLQVAKSASRFVQ
jgi:hypothetical protein